jgi:CubicO group peptidase (beta-lactamase class C family)
MSHLDRRHFLAVLAAGIAAPRNLFAATSSEAIAQRLEGATRDGKVPGLHALLVSQGGKPVFAHYGQGVDVAWDRPLGEVTFGPEVLHDLRSVSKSVVGLAYGIALAAGKVPPPDAKLYDQFPEYADLAAQPGRDKLTVGHVLSMTMGLEWDELSVPYGDPRNSEDAMDAAPDRYRYILSLPITGAPGEKWIYCGGATALLGHLIARGTGMRLLDYARRTLFEPMGFGPADWAQSEKGELFAASGLRLLPRDMLKLGELVLHDGDWQGRRLVSAEWIKTMTTPVVEIDRSRRYGYHWYLGDVTPPGGSQPRRWIGGIGWGGQRLFVLPDLDLVVAINCGNYDKGPQEQSRISGTLFAGVVLPLVS